MSFTNILSKIYALLDFFTGETYSIYLFFALMGLFLLIKHKKMKLELIILILIMILNLSIFYYYYVYVYTINIQARRFVLNIPILLPFILISIKMYMDWCERLKINKKAIISLFSIFVMISIFSAMSFMHIKSVVHVRDLANWIDKNRNSLHLSENKELTILTDSSHGITYWLKGNSSRINRIYSLGKNIPREEMTFVYNKTSNDQVFRPDLLFFPSGGEHEFVDNLTLYVAKNIITKINTPWDHVYSVYKINKYLSRNAVNQL